MGQFVKENAHLNIDLKAYGENYDRIFGKKESLENLCCTICGKLEEDSCGCHDEEAHSKQLSSSLE